MLKASIWQGSLTSLWRRRWVPWMDEWQRRFKTSISLWYHQVMRFSFPRPRKWTMTLPRRQSPVRIDLQVSKRDQAWKESFVVLSFSPFSYFNTTCNFAWHHSTTNEFNAIPKQQMHWERSICSIVRPKLRLHHPKSSSWAMLPFLTLSTRLKRRRKPQLNQWTTNPLQSPMTQVWLSFGYCHGKCYFISVTATSRSLII